MSDTIYRLPIHLPDRQNVVFQADGLDAALLRAANRPTKLTAYFNLNLIDHEAHRYLYAEIPEFYVLKEREHQWEERQRGTCLTRINYIHPTQRELFHLRLLLLHIRGATSFENLRTINGHVFNTFTEAAVAMGIVQNVRIWNETIEEALQVEISSSVRTLFAMICINCNPVNPSAYELWQTYSERMSYDFIHFNQDTLEVAMQKSLQHIQTYVTALNQSMVFYGLPEPDPNMPNFRERNQDQQVVDPDYHREKLVEMAEQFNEQQRYVFETVTTAMREQNLLKPKCYFLDGPGGSGKTFVLQVK